MYRFSSFIEKREGFVGKAFWVDDGEFTVGFGFNLTRDDADDMLEAAGAPTKDQLSKGAVLSRPQATRLLQATTTKLGIWMKKHFEGVPMEQHRWVALMSLAYNSRWNDDGPTLIGPRLTKDIKAGDWRGAAYEIEFLSEGGVAAKHLNGIRARRKHEAAMFIGQGEGR